MLSDLNFALQITTPIFFIIGLGFLFKRIGWLNDDFANMGSALVFKVTLPCLLFTKLSTTDFTQGLPTALVIYGFIATLLIFLLLDVFATKLIAQKADKGVFVQGAFRSNMGIISLAFVVSAYGEKALGIASIYLAVLTIVFNILSVITLTRHLPPRGTNRVGGMLLSIIKNPLIISIVAGVLVSLLNIPIPEIALHTGEYFAGMTLPLALLCAGASIRIKEFHSSSVLYWSSAMKLIFVPLVFTTGGFILGFRGEELGILYLMCAAPTAAASYPMVQAMQGNHFLAAAIIAVTSTLSLVTTTLGIFLLKVFALI
ncbi:AEC family transporter [Aliiglaciecola sp. 3_MG-2023]|uniref:AEC family transporter n=1 Tax=Aliiglaciecola sp. 3_MG-2023 TaxID=3062644 RepID=UPI0026E3B0A1|nr:AEC family transporter [Aliiglaciecola sp. 3_MG-2023]MDO6692646.1 AEC family transporter [Aliiglaciecola sp. 3_MG-2023]